MRIALCKSSLLIPPTYFAVAHAQIMKDEFEFSFFTMAAEVKDPTVSVEINDFAPFRSKPFAAREKYLPLVMPAMARAVVKFDPDVIHQHFATWSWPAVRAGRASGTPLIATLHGADVVMAGKQARTAMQRWHHYNIGLVQRNSTRILAVSDYLAGEAVESGFPADKIVVHYLGVDTDSFVPEDRRQAIDHRVSARPVILFVGALNDQKGILHLLKASKELQGRFEHDLVIVGRGPHYETLMRTAAGNPRIQVLGQLGRAEILSQLQCATLLVAPSRQANGAREAAGLVILEAQACGTPVVAYASGGTPEMVGPQSGLLTAEDDIDGLRESIAGILAMDSKEYLEMRFAAREFTLKERSLEGSARELAVHYASVAG